MTDLPTALRARFVTQYWRRRSDLDCATVRGGMAGCRWLSLLSWAYGNLQTRRAVARRRGKLIKIKGLNRAALRRELAVLPSSQLAAPGLQDVVGAPPLLAAAQEVIQAWPASRGAKAEYGARLAMSEAMQKLAAAVAEATNNTTGVDQ